MKRYGTLQQKESRFGFFLALPSILFFLGIIVFPVAFAAYLSLNYADTFHLELSFVGLDNYLKALFNDQFFAQFFYQGLVYGVGSVILQLGLGIGIALVLNEEFKGRSLVRGLSLLPYVIPFVIGILVFRWLLEPVYGFVNYLIIFIGGKPVAWLGKDYIMFTLILISVWIFTPFVTVSVLARLQTIDQSLYDSAKVDGAGKLMRFRHVTLPALREVIFVVVILRTLWMFTKFDVPYLLAATGGAGKYITNLPVYAFETTFGILNAGYGATICMILIFILAIVVTVSQKIYEVLTK